VADGNKVALRHERGERLPCVRVVGVGRRELRLRRDVTVAHAAPNIELEGSVEKNTRCARAVAAGLAAAVSEQANGRVERRAGNLHISCGLLDARRRELEVGVISQRFVDQRDQHRSLNRRASVATGCAAAHL
jgi:hypothetical protein